MVTNAFYQCQIPTVQSKSCCEWIGVWHGLHKRHVSVTFGEPDWTKMRWKKEGKHSYLTTHSTHLQLYGIIDIIKITQIMKEETCLCHLNSYYF